ncbi:serine protease easter-like [Anopheles bellator]|uniref:serine protease easter-like n=1 Tax=Anopheles bellator TaxID=139047 RepID=UPI00264A2152|nr:serine protease easter-like [Anopheles bellator]
MARCWSYAIAAVGTLVLLIAPSTTGQTCGRRQVDKMFLIHNGQEAKPGYWPWHAALFESKVRSFDYICGGSILDQNTILTAAHCLVTPNGLVAVERLSVQVGRNRFLKADKRGQEHEAHQLIPHPDFDINDFANDIALIKLATDITYTDYVQPVCLWNRDTNLQSIVGMKGFIVGFGFNEKDVVSDYLKDAEIPVVDSYTCINSNPDAFSFKVKPEMYCAGNRDGVSACNGDSGGGMVFNYANVWYIRGLVSFIPLRGQEAICDPNQYTVFTDVAKYLSWIQKNIRQAIGGSTGVPVHTSVDRNPKLRLLNLDVCGTNRYSNTREFDKQVFLGYPWMGLLEYAVEGERERQTVCHGTLISDRYVLTAGHCVNSLPRRYRLTAARFGDFELSTSRDCAAVNGQQECAPPTQVIRIESAIVHQNFNTPKYANDIALLRLREKAIITQSNVKPICLPVTNDLRSHKPTSYTLTGWPTNGNTLFRSQREVVDSVECQANYTQHSITLEKTFRQICVKQDAHSAACHFPKSAAALQTVQKLQGDDRYVMHGLLSYGPKECTHAYPDVYTYIGPYMDWILNNMNE